jgi:hypothetical protein
LKKLLTDGQITGRDKRVFVLIRVRRHYETSQLTQWTDPVIYFISGIAAATAYNTNRKTKFRTICGSNSSKLATIRRA